MRRLVHDGPGSSGVIADELVVLAGQAWSALGRLIRKGLADHVATGYYEALQSGIDEVDRIEQRPEAKPDPNQPLF